VTSIVVYSLHLHLYSNVKSVANPSRRVKGNSEEAEDTALYFESPENEEKVYKDMKLEVGNDRSLFDFPAVVSQLLNVEDDVHQCCFHHYHCLFRALQAS